MVKRLKNVFAERKAEKKFCCGGALNGVLAMVKRLKEVFAEAESRKEVWLRRSVGMTFLLW